MFSGILAGCKGEEMEKVQLFVSYPIASFTRIPSQLDKNINIHDAMKDTANPFSHHDMASS